MKKIISLAFMTFIYTFSLSQTYSAYQDINKIYAENYNINFFACDNKLGYVIGYDQGSKTSSYSSSNISVYINKVFSEGYKINCIAFKPDGDGWVLCYGKGMFWYYNISSSLESKLRQLAEYGYETNYVQFSNNGGCVIIYDGGTKSTLDQFPDDAGNAINGLTSTGENIKCVSFTPSGGWVILYGRNGWKSSNAPDNATQLLHEMNDANQEIYSVVFSEYSEYVILYDGGIKYNFEDNYHVTNYLNSLNTTANWVNLDINNIVLTDGTSIAPCGNVYGDNILTLTAAFVRDNGEHSWRDPAGIGLQVLVSDDLSNWYELYNIPLIGRNYAGVEDRGGCTGYGMMEWKDYEAIRYFNYGILDWDAYPNYKYLRIRLEEGDHEHNKNYNIPRKIIKYSPFRWVPGVRSAFVNDVIFDMYMNADDLKCGKEIKIDGAHNEDATLWLKTKRRL